MPSIQVVPPVKVVLTPVGLQTFDVIVSAPNPVVQVLSEGPQGPVGATGATGPAGPGVPTGGSAGEVLAKTSATDFDSTWLTTASWRYASFIPAVGRYFANDSPAVSITLTNNRLYLVPLVIPVSMRVDRISCRVWTAGTGGTVIRLGVYAATETGDIGVLLFDAGTVAGDTTGEKEITIDEPLSAGIVFMAIAAQGGGPAVSRQNATDLGRSVSIWNTLNIASSASATQLLQNSVTGALPATPSTFSLGGNHPLVGLRRSA